MKKKSLLAFCTAACAVAAAPAAGQLVLYTGGGFISDSSGCQPGGWVGVTQFLARYLPGGGAGNPDASLSLFFPTYALNYSFSSNFEFGVFTQVIEVGSLGNGAFVGTTSPLPRIRITLPAATTTIGGSAAELHYLLDFQNFNFDPGCTVRGELWVRRRS